MKTNRLRIFVVAAACILASQGLNAGPDAQLVLAKYYTRSTDAPCGTDKDGFITRWMMLEPIKHEVRSNSVFNDEYLREVLGNEYFKDQYSLMPYDGQTVKVGKEKLAWHALDSKIYFVNLMRFAEGLGKEYYGQMYWVVTTIHCDEAVENVRLSAGVNSAAVWWLNDEEVLMLSNDRDLIVDDCMSKRLTLKKGENVIRGVVFNGPGMADFCLRFVDEAGQPVKHIRVSSRLKK